MKIKKPKIVEMLEVTAIADGGYGIAKHEGKVIFIEKAVPGDVADVVITKNKKDFAIGFPQTFHTLSNLRVTPFCEHFGICGGCTWQNVSYETQLQFKKQLVDDAFRLTGKFVKLPQIKNVLPSPHEKYYRNKLEFTFSNKKWFTNAETDQINKNENALGFHVAKRFDKILDIKHCYLQPSPSNEIRLAARAYSITHNLSFYDLREQKGFLRNILIRNTSLHNLMVIVVVAENNPTLLFPLLEHLQKTFPEITSLNYALNQKLNDWFYDLDVICYAGKRFITEQIAGIKYRLGPKSFFQTNTEQAKNLYHIALQFADLKKDDVVYDLYSGLGSIALLAAKSCKKITGVETIDSAVEDAKLNAQINGITNCEFVCGDLAKIFTDEFIEKYGKANVVITDPPRTGMHKDVCLQLLKLNPDKIIYVSCNPVTQARDIQILSEQYDVKELQPVDMFPQTYHVECVALLENKTKINLF